MFYAVVREGKKLSYAYCSEECRQKTVVRYERPKLSARGANPAMTGARSELVVSADLIARGYYVFRSVSPSAPFDLIAYKNTVFRVEVTTGVHTKNGLLHCKKAGRPHADCIAVVCNGYQITYLNAKDLAILDMD